MYFFGSSFLTHEGFHVHIKMLTLTKMCRLCSCSSVFCQFESQAPATEPKKVEEKSPSQPPAQNLKWMVAFD